jgi:hypothetical protein
MPESAPFAPTPPRPGEGFPRPWWRRLPARRSLRPLLREALGRLRGYSLTRQPPPPTSDVLGSAAYGAAQPILGMRILAADAELLREAFIPAGWLALFCAVIAALGAGPGDPGLLTKRGGSLLAFAAAFYKIFAALAVAPPILFANHYARLAAQVRYQLGFGACAPREASLWFFAKRSAQSVILVAFAVAPFYLLERAPIVGHATVALLGLWGLHWVVVDALDDARVLLPGETLKSAEAAAAQNAPQPWFVRAFLRAARALSTVPIAGRPLAFLVRAFARVCDRLAVPFREEIALLEQHRALGLGFAVATSALLAIPGLNLLFRPIIIVAASHLLGHLEATEAAHGHPGAPALGPSAERASATGAG